MPKVVRIQSALYGSEELQGDFNYIKGPYLRAGQKRDAMFKILRNGEVNRVHVFNHHFQILDDGTGRQYEQGESATPTPIASAASSAAGTAVTAPASGFHVWTPPPPPTPEEIEELGKKIARRFQVMQKLVEGVVNGKVRSLIMSGAAGVGKSYTLEKRLVQAEDEGDIDKYTILKGRISGLALYCELFKHREEGQILVLDDNDVVFQDEVSLNVLKGALDTGDVRRLSWKTAGTYLEDNGIDDEFEFNGCCVFVTNLDFDRMIEKGSVLAPHFKALISRCIYLDLLIHTPLQIMVRIEQVVNTTAIVDAHGIDDTQKELMMNWLWDNYSKMRELSLRSVLKIGSFMNTDMSDWEDMCNITMIKSVL